jgi:hypothetical protein
MIDFNLLSLTDSRERIVAMWERGESTQCYYVKQMVAKYESQENKKTRRHTRRSAFFIKSEHTLFPVST